jgi:hypothetical protein
MTAWREYMCQSNAGDVLQVMDEGSDHVGFRTVASPKAEWVFLRSEQIADLITKLKKAIKQEPNNLWRDVG